MRLKNKKKYRDHRTLSSGRMAGGIAGGKTSKIILFVAAIALILILIGAGASVLDGLQPFSGLLRDTFSGEEALPEDYLTFDDADYVMRDRIESFLFMGTDYSGNEEGQGEAYEGSMSDFLMLMIIDHTEDTYAFLPLDRNTIVDVPIMEQDGSGEATVEAQLCTAHAYGGSKEMSCENTTAAVSAYLGGLPVDGYYALSMSEIPALNHALGGVEVTLEDDFTSFDPQMKKGAVLTLTDEQAELYLHERMNMEDDANTRRMERQRTYMNAAVKKAKANLRKNPDYYKELSAAFENAATSSITGKQTSRAANALIKYEDLGSFRIEGETKTGTILDDGEEHEEFYPDPESVLSVMTEICHLEPSEDNDD